MKNDNRAIPCLSIRQPQAELIVRGLKNIEYRNWWTGYRGEMYIHAPLQIDTNHLDIINIQILPKQAIIGKATLYDITESSKDNYKWAFHLKNPIKLKRPIENIPGHIRFFYL